MMEFIFSLPYLAESPAWKGGLHGSVCSGHVSRESALIIQDSSTGAVATTLRSSTDHPLPPNLAAFVFDTFD